MRSDALEKRKIFFPCQHRTRYSPPHTVWTETSSYSFDNLSGWEKVYELFNSCTIKGPDKRMGHEVN